MKFSSKLRTRQGFTLILTLMVLSMMSFIVVSFFTVTTQQATMASYYSKNLLTELSTVAVSERVIGEIRDQIRLKSTEISPENSQNGEKRYRPIGTDDEESSSSPSQNTSATHVLSLPQSVTTLLTHSSSSPWKSDSLDQERLYSNVRWGRIGFNRSEEEPTSGAMQVISTSGRISQELLVQGKVYDVGGLCDVNVVPWGSKVTDTEKRSKSYSYDIDFSQLSALSSDKMNLIGSWLQGNDTGSVEARLKDYHRNGFLNIDPEGRAFISRQEMLSYLKSNSYNERAAEYLTTFSREVNAPSVRPKPTGTTFSAFESRDLYTFKYNAESNDSWTLTPRKPNRDFAALPMRSTSTGEKRPVMTKRFPLRKIDLLAAATGSVGVDSDIYRYFGLTRSGGSSSPWVYSAGTTDENKNTKIYQLNDPAFIALNREPNFFELLQAGILAGSMGQNIQSNDGSLVGLATSEMIFWSAQLASIKNPSHLFNIGLNIIDQWDADGYPTMLQIKGRNYKAVSQSLFPYYDNAKDLVLYGQEGLPVVNSFNYFIYRPAAGTGMKIPGTGVVAQTVTMDCMTSWIVPEFWQIESFVNQPSSRPSTMTLTLKEGKFKLTGSGKNVTVTPNTTVNITSNADAPFLDYSLNPIAMTINTSSITSLRTPKLLDTTLSPVLSGAGAIYSPSETLPGSGTSYVGFAGPYNSNVGDRRLDSNTPKVLPNNFSSFSFVFSGGSIPIRLPLRFAFNYNGSSSISPYVSYNGFGDNLVGSSNSGSPTSQNSNGSPAANYTDIITFRQIFGDIVGSGFTRSSVPLIAMRHWLTDPRTLRFGAQDSRDYGSAQSDALPDSGTYPWMGASQEILASANASPVGPLFYPFNYRTTKNATSLGQIVFSDYGDNRTPGTGINPHSSYPLSYYKDNDGIIRRGDGNYTYGVYPNHPTQTTSRPLILNRPFTNVAEMGYAYRDIPWKTLDFFSKNSADRALLDLFTLEEEPEVVAGKINFHAASNEVLAALLEGTEVDPIAKSKIGQGSIDSSTIAKNLESLKGKIENKSDIVRRLETIFPESSNLDTAIKWRRESVVRGLISSIQTRTWNLCLDLNCQLGKESGKIRSAGSGAHVWVNVAIDRYTNEIVDRQVEWVR